MNLLRRLPLALLLASLLAPAAFAQAVSDPQVPAERRSARAEAPPTWAELSPPQQQALAPLAGNWSRLGATHKRKWIALSANYAALAPTEQALLHSRMGEWAALSPQQRTQARLNFAETKRVSRRDRMAKWEAYQALSPEEKRKLAEDAAAHPPPPATAAATEPVPQQKLVRVPRAKKDKGEAATRKKVDRNTLLPQPGSGLNP